MEVVGLLLLLGSGLTAAAAVDVPEIYHARRSPDQTSFVKGGPGLQLYVMDV